MVTLKLNKYNLICSLLLFSGQNDPSWEIEYTDDLERIRSIIDSAKEIEKEISRNSKLGYHGVSIKSEAGLYLIFNGIIECFEKNNPGKILQDKDRKLEILLLNLSKEKFNDLITNILQTEF